MTTPAPLLHINRQLFIDTMEALQKQFLYDKKYYSLLCSLAGTSEVESYQNHFIINALVKLLQQAMNDETSTSMIEFFMLDLEFGEKYERGRVMHHGKEVELRYAWQLYDYLISLDKINQK